MRLITFSFLKKWKLKSLNPFLSYKSAKLLSSDGKELLINKFNADPSLIEVNPTWQITEETLLRMKVMEDMKVIPEFVSEQEESSLLAEVEPRLKRMRYEFDHWDNAIEGFRETEYSKWKPENEAVMKRVRQIGFSSKDVPLEQVHVLDLSAGGHIKPHVDAVRFCGDVITGISLLSTAVMRLQHTDKSHLVLDALLPRRSLYIMRGVARHLFTHAVLGGDNSIWRGKKVQRKRRIAIINRSRVDPDVDESPSSYTPQ